MIDDNKLIPVILKWEHPLIFLHNSPGKSLAWCHLSESQLRQLHRRFGHPSARGLIDLHRKAGQKDFQTRLVKNLTKVCLHCQMSAKNLSRVKFTIKDDTEFNYMIIIDIFYIEGKPIVHVLDLATGFQAAKFLKDISTKTVRTILCMCWTSVYLGPSYTIIHDA